ncbi:LLM class flavin-dependent oxidoreductase [uncultured Corynebacterium sp.]|uniref:LLM class flavin-dependent oxidoreductase n=1 Tax=uncultured Corynebacterium sp. TaxID=159447 RepID=UPI0025F59640|nr:LLM class flavin-dependent oxidoreductase [uncultured Corynebacterium sp.]
MKAFGFLSFGHYAFGGTRGPSAEKMAQIHLELAKATDEIGVNNASFRVHHFVPQASAPMPLLGAVAGATKHIEVGTGVIDMRYENLLYLAEEAASLYQLSGGRVALGVSRGAPEVSERGWEAFGYKGEAPNGADVARDHLEKFMAAVDGNGFATAAPLDRQYPNMFQPGSPLPVFPFAPELRKHVFYGSGTHASAEQTAKDGLNLMSSTLVSETTAQTLGEVQVEQINRYRAAWKEAGHDWTPRVSVSRSIFPIIDGADMQMFGMQAPGRDQVGMLPDTQNASIFGRTYAAEPDKLIEQLKADPAVMAADTLLITVPTGMGVDVNVKILDSFATYVAPELGWEPNTQGPVTGYAID